MKAALLAALSSKNLPTNLLPLRTQEQLDDKSVENLIEFILQDSTDRSELANMQRELARAWLLEPFSFEQKQIQALAQHRLNNEQLIHLIFELLSSNSKFSAEEQPIVRKNVEELIAILLIRATKPAQYQQLISGRSNLANLLMRKRLETLTKPESQQALISELLENYQCYDWEDTAFSAFVQSTLLTVFTKSREKEFKTCFSRYYSQHAKTHAAEVTELIGELLKSTLPTQWLQSCIEQDKSILQQPHLATLFLEIPKLSQGFLDNHLKTIKTPELLNLLMFIIERHEDQQSIPTNVLDQIVNCFCLRLNAEAGNDDPIHQWQKNDSAPLLALYIASRPSYLQSLTSLSFKQSYLAKNPVDAIENRAVAVIEFLDCDSRQFQNIARTMLCHFQKDPQPLQTLFSNLELASASLKKQDANSHPRFHDNYLSLKQACWKLLVHEQPYEEKTATQLLTTQLTIAHCFDWLLVTLINNKSDDRANPAFLSQVDIKSLIYIQPKILAAVLLQSITKETASNWQKVEELLKYNIFEDQLAFTKALIEQLVTLAGSAAKTTDPKLVPQGSKLITSIPNFAKLIVALSPAELQWLLKNSPESYLKDQFPSWLDTILDQQKFGALNGYALLALLPSNQEFLENLFTRDKLTPFLPQLFVQFAKQEIYDTHQVALFLRVSTLSNSEKKIFIDAVQRTLIGQVETIRALPALTTLLQGIAPPSKELIRNQLRLFREAASHTEAVQPQKPELQQAVFNLLTYLSMQDKLWVDEILNDANFAAIAPLWLTNIAPTQQNYHPFTHLILDHTTAKIHPKLLENPDYQQYLQTLLSNPPEAMTNNQFILLFKQQLLPANQKSLARKLLPRTTLEKAYDLININLSRALTIKELYDLAIDTEAHLHAKFIELIAEHPNGLKQLSRSECNTLFASLNNHIPLLHILESDTSSEYKIKFVNGIFEYIEQHHLSLADWLEKLHVDGPTLAALANYTINSRHQKLISDLLVPTARLASFSNDIKDYLQNPTLNSSVEPEGLLYSIIQHTFLNPNTGWRCHPSLFPLIRGTEIEQRVPGAVQQRVLGKQLLFLNELHLLQDFYIPFGNCDNDFDAPLNAARWLHRLPLLSQGLLKVIQNFSEITDPGLQAALKKTRLYQQLIEPILFQQVIADLPIDNTRLLMIQFNELYDLLTEYSKAIATDNPEYSNYLNWVIEGYQIKLHVMEHASFAGAHDLFHPQLPTGQIQQRALPLNWDEHSKLLVHASFLHDEQLAKTLSPSSYLTSLINLFIDNPKWLKSNSEFQAWLFICLTSPLTAAIPEDRLAKLLTHFPTHVLIEQLDANQEKLEQFQIHFEMLTQLNTLKTLKNMLNHLLSNNTSTLIQLFKVCEFAQLPYLASLIHFALQIKNSGLSDSQLMRFLLPTQLTSDFELSWLQLDLEKLDETKERLMERQNTLILAAFNYQPASTQKHLLQLAKLSLVTTDSKILTDCLSSYLPIFEDEDSDAPFIDQFLAAVIKLLESVPDSQVFISALPPNLVNQMMSAALKSPGNYKSFILKLMDAGDITRHLVQIKTQLAALISQYKPQPALENLTLSALSADEIAEIDPLDFKRILFLQRLLLQISPTADLAPWVNAPLVDAQLVDDSANAERRIRAYFAADASLYEQIINLPEPAVATDGDEHAVNYYQTNLHNAYAFLKHDNYVLIYGDSVEQYTEASTPIGLRVLYHYLNIAPIVTNDSDISEQDRLSINELLEHANLPLDVLERLRKNCPSIVIDTIYGIHLLCRPDFIAALPGKPLLADLEPNSNQRIKKRLHSVVQSIDLTKINHKTLHSIQPEAAATLFCSVPHFHQLNETTMSILLERVGAQRDLLINCWINAYTDMPNFAGALFKLMGLYPNAVTNAIKHMPLTNRQKTLLTLFSQAEHEDAQTEAIKLNQIPTLTELIDDYLTECENDSYEENDRLQLAALTHQLIGGKVTTDSNRQVLLNNFWNLLKASNGRTMACSLQQDTKKFIHTLSLQRSPAQLLELFDKALPHLTDPDQERTKKIVEKARAEAALEDRLSKLSFLKSLRRWLARCSFYGYTGFFTPKKPTYLASVDEPIQQNKPAGIPTNVAMLNELARTITPGARSAEIILFFKTLANYEQETKNKDEELIIRNNIDQLFNQILEKCQASQLPKGWLPDHMAAFLTNRNQLIALYCTTGQKEALHSLLLTTKGQGLHQFTNIISELLEDQDTADLEDDYVFVDQSLSTKNTAISYIKKIPEALGGIITEQIHAIPGHLQTIQEHLPSMPQQLRDLSRQLRRVPAHLRTLQEHLPNLPDQLRDIPGQVWGIPGQLRTMPADLASYFGGHFNFFARIRNRSGVQEPLAAEAADVQHEAPRHQAKGSRKS